MDLLIGMIGSPAKLRTDRTSITEVLALFYEELYRSRADKQSGSASPGSFNMKTPKFNLDELTGKAGKAKDSKGFVEDFKDRQSKRQQGLC